MKTNKTLLAAILLMFFFLDLHAQVPMTKSVFDAPPITILNDSNPSPGYIFLTGVQFTPTAPKPLLILDEHGSVIFDRAPLPIPNSNVFDFKPQPGGKYSYFNASTNSYYILDKNFQIIDSVAAKYFQTDNHEFLIDENNHYFLMGVEQRVINMADSVVGGNPQATVVGIVVQELDTAKNVVFQWQTLDHLPVTQSKGLDLTSNYIDYIHTNSLCIDTDSTILLSNRHLNEITKVNRRTGNVVWRMGLNSSGNEFLFLNDSAGFSYQHCVRRLPNGNITLFDNGNFRPGERYSRACEYKIDEVNKTATLVWQYRNTPDVVSGFMGSVQRLPNGNTLIGWGGTSPAATEVDSSCNKVFECSLPSGIWSYRAFKFEVSNMDSLRTANVRLPDAVTTFSYDANTILERILGDSAFEQSRSNYFLTEIDSNKTVLAYKNVNDFVSYKTILLLNSTITSVKSSPAQNAQPQLSLYPNPSAGDIHMATDITGIIPVAVYNSVGELIMQKKVSATETFENLQPGTYTMLISLPDKNLSCKFVITH